MSSAENGGTQGGGCFVNTSLMKNARRLVTSQFGVLSPAVPRPLICTVFENQIHGSDMVCSVMVDVLLEAVTAQQCLPKHIIIQADSAQKETKNVCCVLASCAAEWHTPFVSDILSPIRKHT
eukprot:5066478-Amphidinium_carterae.1